MTKIIASNAGVHAQNGFAFQRNSAVCLILDRYDLLISKNFFVCIEHFDDIVFTFVNDKNKVKRIDSYQAKKSASTWATDKVLGEIISKMTKVGASLLLDDMPKADNYKQNLIFLTNKSVKLNNKKNEEIESLSEILKEDNLIIYFSKLHESIRDNLVSKMIEYDSDYSQLSNVAFKYMDFTSTDKSQKEQMVGKILKIFDNKNIDANAALDLILSLFRDVETIYNQGDYVRLLDESKRVYSSEIFRAFNVVENKTKAYELWRLMADDISNKLQISVEMSMKSKHYINNSFDYFKDLKMVDFQKIYNFVRFSEVDKYCFSIASSILKLNEDICKNVNLNLPREVVLFAIIAAYVQKREV